MALRCRWDLGAAEEDIISFSRTLFVPHRSPQRERIWEGRPARPPAPFFASPSSSCAPRQRLLTKKRMAATHCVALHSSLPHLIASARLKRILLPPESSPLYAAPKSRFLGVVVRSRRHWLRVRSMATEGNQQAVEVPRSVPVRVAHELLQAGHRYLDVRTPEEFSAGHAVGAVNVPYMWKVGSGMTKNPKFLEEVSSIYGKDDEIIVGCQSGKRSLMAATDLTSAGFTGITDIAGGYSAWVQNGLPSE